MTIKKVYAHLSCSDLARSIAWFERVFGRAPDARPMNGLAEWHHQDSAGLQLFEDVSNAGRGTVTLIVRDLPGERSRLTERGLEPPGVQPADTTAFSNCEIRTGTLWCSLSRGASEFPSRSPSAVRKTHAYDPSASV